MTVRRKRRFERLKVDNLKHIMMKEKDDELNLRSLKGEECALMKKYLRMRRIVRLRFLLAAFRMYERITSLS
jgi:hypothetical protein